MGIVLLKPPILTVLCKTEKCLATLLPQHHFVHHPDEVEKQDFKRLKTEHSKQ